MDVNDQMNNQQPLGGITTVGQTKKWKNIFLIIGIVLIFALAVLSYFGYVNLKTKQGQSEVESGALTEDQKAALIEELNKMNESVPPLSDQAKETMIENLNQATEEATPLTEEQKANMMSELNSQ